MKQRRGRKTTSTRKKDNKHEEEIRQGRGRETARPRAKTTRTRAKTTKTRTKTTVGVTTSGVFFNYGLQTLRAAVTV